MRSDPVRPSLTGNVAGYRLSGVEPDGDPLYQVFLDTRLSSSGDVPALHLIINAYMENFKPDTTPILPDLLHPGETARNLGGFLQGKAIFTDDAGSILYRGTFTAEAFLDNTNHVIIAASGVSAARNGAATLKGAFTLRKDGSLGGTLHGRVALSREGRRQIAAHRGASMPKLETLLKSMSVVPHPMVGRSTSSSSSKPLDTGYGSTASSHRPISPLTVGAGLGALVSFLLAGALWWWQRRVPA